MPDDFNAYRSNYQPGCSDAQVSEHYDGGGDVEDGTDSDEILRQQLNTNQNEQE